MTLTRRNLITGAGAAAVAPALPAAAVGPWRAEVDFGNGTVWKFDQAQAVDKGSIVQPAFTQKCLRHAPAGIPMHVDFRPDADGARQEVVFELCKFGATDKNLGAYTARIYDGATLIATQAVPKHYGAARWRWQSARRPRRRTAAELIAAKQVPPYDKAAPRRAEPGRVMAKYKPMAWTELGFAGDMGATGERPEIGLVTEAVARWLVLQDDPSFDSMMEQAEAHATMPVHFRDATGSAVSIDREPNASSYYDRAAVGANPWYSYDPANAYVLRPESAHYPNQCYVAYMATFDPFLLEELQFAANYFQLAQNPAYRGLAKGSLLGNQTRGVAWTLHIWACAAMATQAVPGWLLPKTYFVGKLEHNRSEFDRLYLKGGSNNSFNKLHIACDQSPNHVAPWQQDMLSASLACVARMFPEWAPQYAWQFRQAVERTNGTSGYPRSQAIQYYFDKVATAASWAELAAKQGLKETPDGKFPPKSDASYIGYLRGALKLGVLNNQPDAATSLAYVDPQAPSVSMRWSF
ncbi:MAG: hypothetical protein IT562_03950 [Alphaproteobacteria bacterium]|nr:hypothetical protein [Alphaproteobacteria bacterium]